MYHNHEVERLGQHYENVNALELQTKFFRNFDDNILLVVVDQKHSQKIKFLKNLQIYIRKLLPE